MTGGSQQLRIFRRAYRDTGELEAACAATGMIECEGKLIPAISPAEGRIYLANDLKNPPPPEAFELIGQQPRKEPAMGAAARQEPQNGGEYKKPDAAKAIEIYDRQIKPKLTQINTLKGDLSDPWGDLKEHARISKKDFNYVQGLVDEEDDAKRDHRLLSLYELLKARRIALPSDLVTRAEGIDGASIVPFGERKRPQLATLPMGVPSDGTETDLGDAGDGFTEATDEELAAQRDRPSVEAERVAAEEAAEGEALQDAAE